jgi:hypothetical protein
LWSCLSSVAVWQESRRRVQKLSLTESGGLGLLQQLLDKLEEEDFLEAVTVLRLIWLRRNTLVFEGSFTPPAILLGQAKIKHSEFVQAISPEIDQTEAVQTSSSWKSPPFGVLKANWDVAVNSKEQLVGVGVVIRSHEGAVKAAFHAVEKGITDPAAA